MKVSSATFDGSFPDWESCPEPTLPEFAFIGRSNVGKSSLLNMIMGRELAKVSGKPGSTRLLNFFSINEQWRLVDLPGYGYARTGKKERNKLADLIAEFLQYREGLRVVFTLIDSRIDPQPIDLSFLEWLLENGVPYQLVFTKVEKVKAGKREKLTSAYYDFVMERSGVEPTCLFTSSKKGTGLREIRNAISQNGE